MIFHGRKISPGSAEGEALVTSMGISFYGGIDPETGQVVEKGHALEGQSIGGKVLVFPTGKGSTVGSYTLYRLKKAGKGPGRHREFENPRRSLRLAASFPAFLAWTMYRSRKLRPGCGSGWTQRPASWRFCEPGPRTSYSCHHRSQWIRFGHPHIGIIADSREGNTPDHQQCRPPDYFN